MKKGLPCVWLGKLSTLFKKKILVSSCLLGNRVRYDGNSKLYDLSMLDEYELVTCCPEVDGGLSVPRAMSEIQLDGTVINIHNEDVTDNFNKGAKRALDIAISQNIKVAILKSKSPSCSNSITYDGSFCGRLINRKGITVKVLEENGIIVFDENHISDALIYLKELYDD